MNNETAAQEASPAVAPAAFKRFAFGQLIPEHGGHYAGLIRGQDGKPDYHLFVAPDDAAEDGVEWGGYRKDADGAKSVNDGAANTDALIAEGGHPAAEACKAYRFGGFDDWYLPAQAELNVCFANAREVFKPEWYWSSTQCSPDCAWMQDFGTGLQYLDLKGNNDRVRAVRRLLVL